MGREVDLVECRVSVGNVEVLGLTDAIVDSARGLKQLFPDVPLEAWAPYRERYPEVFSAADSWRGHFGCYLIRSQGRTVLVDTGIGDRTTNPNFIAVFLNDRGEGRLLDELKGVGVSPDDVDTVVLSHLHPDHVGWNLSGSGPDVRPTFPKARYLVHRDDWNAFRRPDVIGQFPFGYWEETIGPLESLGVLDLITGEHSLTSEVTVIPTPGHTAGHVSLAIASQGQHGLVMSDVAIHPALVTEDGWASAAEMDPALAAPTRRAFLDRAEAENATVFACHYPARGFGKIVRIDGRRYWQGL